MTSTEQDGLDDFVEAVLSCAEQVPGGQATTYGAIAEAIGRGGPRQVGRVMATHGAAVTWWRVVRADGSLPDDLARRAAEQYVLEGTPRRSSGRVDLVAAFYQPVLNRRTGQ